MLQVTLSFCRSNVYLIIGICLGLTLSLFFAPINFQECQEIAAASAEPNTWYGVTSDRPTTDEYEPKINIEGKPRRAQKTPKAFIRPRYYSTELGIRDKLFVGVITSREYLHSRGVALNKTLAHLVDKMRYFISVPEGSKPNVSLPGIVGFTDTRAILKPFHVMKYITDNYLEDYDYYFVAKDTSYVNGRRLVELVEKISVSRDVHLGRNVDKESYCSLDAGILLSNSVVRALKTSLDWCVKNTFSSSDDVNFGRCLLHASKVACSGAIQGKEFKALNLPTLFDFDNDWSRLTKSEKLEDYLSIYPIFDQRTTYKINAYLAATELTRIESEINSLRSSILGSARLAPEHYRNTSWPIGNQPGNVALGRFDLQPWIYFNATHTFMETDFENVRESLGSTKMDVDRIIESAARRIEKEYRGVLMYERLINGYRKFDSSRGLDYILDLQFVEGSSGKRIVKRIQVCKPLGKVEILAVPYVTENSRINMIFVVNSWMRQESLDFLERYNKACMEKKDKTFLMLVLLYEPNSPSKGTSDIYYEIKQRALTLTERYKKDQLKVTWLSVRLPTPSSAILLDPMLKVSIADLVTKKFTPDSLLLFVESRMDLRVEYLNRVRMNTISQWQIYSPIPFVEYDPDVAQMDNPKKSPPEIDVNRNIGRYDDLNFESISFYVKDYAAMRRRVAAEIPQVRTDKDIGAILELSRRNVAESIFQLFVAQSDLHAFRAVEPALKIRYGDSFSCNSTYSPTVKNNCERRKNYALGNRGQLAKLILDYHNYS